MNHSSKPQQSFSIGTNHLHGVARFDQIRTDTLLSLVAGWADPDIRDEVIESLDSLAEIVRSPRAEGELDAALEQVEDVSGMETAQVEVSIPNVRRLLNELAEVARVLSRFNPAAAKGASEIKHPSMRATRRHLAESPLPEQADRRWTA